jgi:hypothetical protein
MRYTAVVVLPLLVLVGGCRASTGRPQESCPAPEANRLAALENIYEAYGTGLKSEAELIELQSFVDSLQDRCERDAYQVWVDHESDAAIKRRARDAAAAMLTKVRRP